MDCERVEKLLNAYLDRELDLSSTLTLESHLAGCRNCREHHERLTRLTADLAMGLERHVAPDELRERMTLTLAARPVAKDVVHEPIVTAMLPRLPLRKVALGRRQLLALAASVAAVAVVSSASTYWWTRPAESSEMAEQVVASHIRSLMASHLIDIASTDQHTVKPWFDGRVDVAPTVADYTAQGFSLVGGRLDYLARRPVAALVYRHRAHLINMFACPVTIGGEREGQPEAISVHGYNVVYWTAGDVTYWAVSDVNMADLMTFRNLVQDASSSQG